MIRPGFGKGHDHSGPDRDDPDLWFLPAPPDEGPVGLPFGAQAGPRAATIPAAKSPEAQIVAAKIVAEWTAAQAGQAAPLARVAGRLGALDDRLRRGPAGWRHRLAMIEATELGWFAGNRIAPDRLALWLALRLPGVQDDPAALACIGWAVRRLTGGPGPEAGLAEFLGRHDPDRGDPMADRLSDRTQGWHDLMQQARALHPISRACMGYHLWALAGLDNRGDRLEAAVTAGRIAADGAPGAVFAPLAMGGAAGLRAGGSPGPRLARWIEGMDSAILTAMRHLDGIADWAERAQTVMAPLSGRTPPALRAVLTDWPMVSAPMAEVLTGASRAAVQRNLAWMEERQLIREVTGQGRFRMWRIQE